MPDLGMEVIAAEGCFIVAQLHLGSTNRVVVAISTQKRLGDRRDQPGARERRRDGHRARGLYPASLARVRRCGQARR